MDIVVFKEAFDWFVIRFSLSSLAALLGAIIILKLVSLPSRLKINAKRFGWPLVVLFIACSAWATYTAFPTQEEKQAYQEALQKQNAVNQAWSDAMGLGNLDQGADIEPDAGGTQNEVIESNSNTESFNEPESVAEDETVTSDIDGLSITAFEIDRPSCTVAFEATWRNDVFDNAASRSLHLFTATNLLDRLWLPLCLISVPSGTNIYAFAVTSNDVEATSRGWFFDAFNGVGFYRLAVDVDSDGDGVADSVERLWSQTNPLCADSDADRLEDGIELSPEIGSDPLVYDTDGDGVGDGDEIAAGSNPRSSDSDCDGLSDAQEIGTMTAIKEDGFIWFDLSNGTRLVTSQTADGNSWLISLSQGHFINNVCYTNAKVQVDGTVHLLCPTNVNESASACTYGSLKSSEYSGCHVTVALCGDDLYARTNDWGSQILHGAVWADGNVFSVVEYRNVGLYDFNGENETATFQLIIPHHETNTLYVSYLCASNAFRTAEKIVGVQCGMMESQRPNERKYNLAWPSSGKFPEDGFTIKYSIGMGTDPIKADTDGDGLSDADEILNFGTYPFSGDVDGDGLLDPEELSVGTDSAAPDTDNDSMPDGWEVLHSLNPLANDSRNDADSDGVPNKDEYANDTNPNVSDTDGDDLPDAVEAAWADEPVGIPWFDMTDATVLSPASNKDSALYFCELPFTNRIASLPVSIAAADINGIVYLGNDSTTNRLSSSDSARNMAEDCSFPCIAVAPYWTDLYLRTSLNSQISHKTVDFEGRNYFVIQYSRVGIDRRNTNEVSFQVSIPENASSNTVYVKYGFIADDRDDGYKVSIGTQAAHDIAKVPVAYSPPSHLCITNGSVFAYHFGVGSDPADKDSDDDGVLDNLELRHGTNPSSEDSDHDGLPDKWEIDHGVDPVSSSGKQGADGDVDDDLLSNVKEYEYGTNPSIADTDGDGVGDGLETGSIFITNAVPWLSFDELEDVTTEISTNYRRCINRPMPLPLTVQGETVTNMTISANGIIFLNRAGYDNPGDTTSGKDFKYEIDENALVIAPYLEYTYFRTDIPGRETAVKVGTSTHNGEGYLLLEFANAFRDTSTSRTNAISFQVAMPTNCPTRAYVRYKDLLGQYMSGDDASIGMQTFGSRWLHSYCDDDAGKVRENLCLGFQFGANSNPLVTDTDGDGLPDGQEVSIGTSPTKTDTDGDELPDSWEVQNNLDPLSFIADNGAVGDPDGDGVDNYAEYELGTNPQVHDTDNDGLPDGKEAVCVSFANPLPWLEVSVLTNMTDAITNSYNNCLSIDLPASIAIQREIVTNITIDADCVVYFNRAGYAPPSYSRGMCDLGYDIVDTNCFTVAPYWSWLFLSNEAEPSSVKFGTATVGDDGYYVLECLHLYKDINSYETNSISFQMAFPTGRVDKIKVRYADIVGDEMDGRNASIGIQGFNARECISYCYWDYDMVYDGMGLTFVVGHGSDPLVADSDGDGIRDGEEVNTYGSDPTSGDSDSDGLSDSQEATLGTSPNNPDSDGDGLLDGWEVDNSFNPLSAPDNEETDIDTDGDGLTNLQEQNCGGNPRAADTDGDGLDDVVEVANGTNIGRTDSDNDGLSDRQEIDSGFNPLDPDMDRDGMVDGWEVSYGIDPRNSAGDNGADGDLEGDGVPNIDEYLNNTNPRSSDTDDDGVSDRVEIERESDPSDASDGGQPHGPELFRTLAFNIYGDYAAWEMSIEGLGPEDRRIRRVSMGAPDASETSSMKLRKGNAYRLSMRWLNCGDHNDANSPWYCWQAQIDGMPGQKSFNDNYSEGFCVRLPQRNNIVVGNGWIAENEDGLLTSHVHASQKNSHGGSGAGNVAQGLSATLYVLDDPKAIPDYDRDGAIGPADESIYEKRETTFRFWKNDDNDSGDVNDSKNDRPGSGSNGQDDKVNGRGDLLDFTPIVLDASEVFPPGTPDHIKDMVSWKLESSAVNAVWTSLLASEAGRFHKADCGAKFGPQLSQSAHEASVTRLSGDENLPDAFLSHMKDSGDKGVVMIEGCANGTDLKLKGYVEESASAVLEGDLPLSISSVEEMYRYVTLRGAHNNANFTVHIPGAPENLMDDSKDLDVFFTHGFNVSESEAHAWGSEVFKRMWQSGSNARFWTFTWSGDYNWLGSAFNGLHYQQDVYQALKTGAALKALIENAQPDSSKRILMTQSLGNMVACEALRQGLSVGKYFMFNAAVASEAVDGMFQNANQATKSKYVPSDWSNYHEMSWAANWHKWFKDDPADARGKMGWANYFSSALARAGTVYNYYSTGDPVFFESDTVPGVTTGLFHWPTLSWTWPFIEFNITAEEGSWQKQETHKGVEPIAGTLNGGWGFYCWEEDIGGEPVTKYYTASQANDMVSMCAITNSPVFSYGGTPLNNRNATQDDIWLSLAKYIPAVSSPVGGNEVLDDNDFDLNNAMHIARPNGWGRDHNVYKSSWLHSDMKDMAFFYVYPLYNDLATKGNLK